MSEHEFQMVTYQNFFRTHSYWLTEDTKSNHTKEYLSESLPPLYEEEAAPTGSGAAPFEDVVVDNSDDSVQGLGGNYQRFP